MWCEQTKVVNFKDFLRPYEEIKYFSRTLTEFKDFSRRLLEFKTYSTLYELCVKGVSISVDRIVSVGDDILPKYETVTVPQLL